MSLEYNRGMLNKPCPSLNSTVLNYCKSECASQIIKQDILGLVKHIDGERQIYHKVFSSSVKLAVSMSKTSKESVVAVRHRLKEVQVILNIQDIKRYSVKYNNDLRRSYMNSSENGESRRLSQPEHFKRQPQPTITSSKRAPKPSRIMYNDNRTSPWEGSDYKYTLVISLRDKLLLKIVFSALQFNRINQLNIRQCVVSASRNRIKKLIQLCFSSILFESLSSRFIQTTSRERVTQYLVDKYSRPAYKTLKYVHKLKKKSKRSMWRAENFNIASRLRVGLRLLKWNCLYSRRIRILHSWGKQHNRENTQMRAFLAWISVFIQKTQIRRDITARFESVNNTSVHFARSSVAPPLKTPLKGVQSTSFQSTPGPSMRELQSTILNHSLYSVRQADQSLRRIDDHCRFVSSYCDNEMSDDSLTDINITCNISNNCSRVESVRVSSHVTSPSHRNNGTSSSRYYSKSQQSITQSPNNRHSNVSFLPESVRNLLQTSFSARQTLPSSRFPHHTTNTKINRTSNRTANYSHSQHTLDLSPSSGSDSVGSGKSKQGSVFSSIHEEEEEEEEDYRFAVNDGSYSLLDQHTQSDYKLSEISLLDRVIQLSEAPISPHKQQLHSQDHYHSPTHGMHTPTKIGVDYTFCGEVFAQDSDNEEERGGNVTTRRREIMMQIRNQFQMIKFNWIIKMTRRFVRNLKRQASLRRATHLTQRLTAKYHKQRTYRAWCRLFDKYQHQSALCYSIYNVKLSRRILRGWFEYSVQRLTNAKYAVIDMKDRRRQTLAFNSWTDLHSKRMLQERATNRLQFRVKQNVWCQWKAYLKRQSDILSFYTGVRVKATRSVFNKWSEKFRKRSLLKRVFVIQDLAWAHRTYHQSHHFHLLSSVFDAWSTFSQSRRQIALNDELHRRALCFRGVTLQVRYFFAWVDHTRRMKRRCRFVVKRKRSQVRRLFAAWCRLISLSHTQTGSADNWRVYYLKAHTLKMWKRALHRDSVEAPLQYRCTYLLRACFDSWRVMRRTRFLEERVVPLWMARRQFMLFAEWRGLVDRRASYRRGFSRVRTLFNRLRMKQAFHLWPGHAQCIKARYMSQYVMRKGKSRIRLVDVEEGAGDTRGEIEAKSPDSMRSFIAKVRPTMVERAISLGYAYSLHDGHNLNHLRTLLITVLNVWRDHLVVVKHYHGLTMKLRALTNKHRKMNTLRHWITLTPLTACRVVTWIHKRNARLHDEYLYLKKSLADSNEYQLGRREIEKKLGLMR